jgi:hypothetical protein
LTTGQNHDDRYQREQSLKMGNMRKLIVLQWVTVDNIAAEEDGGLSFVSGEPFSETDTSAFKASVMEFIDSVDTLIRLVEALDDAPWGDFPAATVTRDPVATIRKLKEQNGKDIWLWGSLTLMHSLMDAGLVDELQMRVCPASRGKGRRVFEDRQDLKLIEATSFENDVVLLRYEIKK